jgi:hypothetical protein
MSYEHAEEICIVSGKIVEESKKVRLAERSDFSE